VHFDFTTKQSNESAAIADEYVKLGGKSSPENFKNFFDYYSNLKVIFIEQLASHSNLSVDVIARIDADYNLTHTVDPECKQRWLPMGILNNYAPALEPAHAFISSMGRLKYLNPVYLALINSGQKDLAIQWFKENEGFYHPLAVSSLKKMLGLTEKKGFISSLMEQVMEIEL